MGEKPLGLSVRAVVRDGQGRCLVLRRSAACRSNAGKWELPGGKVDSGEAFDAALVREIAEESGLSVTLGHAVGLVEIDDRADVRVVTVILDAARVDGAVRLSEEHDAFAWVPVSELASAGLIEAFVPFAQAYGRSASAEQR